MRCPADKIRCHLCGNKTRRWKDVLDCPIIDRKTRHLREDVETSLQKYGIKCNLHELMIDINQQLVQKSIIKKIKEMKCNPRIKLKKLEENTMKACQEITGSMIGWLTKVNELYFGSLEIEKGKKNQNKKRITEYFKSSSQ